MFEGMLTFFKKIFKSGQAVEDSSKDKAKERLHLVLMQDRANVSADFLDLMKQEIIDVIKKYIVIDEKEIDVRLTNQSNEDGTNGAPALYANIPILNIKNDIKGERMREEAKQNSGSQEGEDKKRNLKEEDKEEDKKEDVTEEKIEEVTEENIENENKEIKVEENKQEIENNELDENKSE